MGDPEPTKTSNQGASPNVSQAELLRWRSVPARRSAKTTALVVLAIFGVPAVLFIWYGPFFGLLGIAILGGSLLSFFLPTDYILTDSTVLRHYLGITQKRKWSEFRSFYPDKNGVLLSPFVRPSRLENFRGLYLRFESNRDKVLVIVQDRVADRSPEDEK